MKKVALILICILLLSTLSGCLPDISGLNSLFEYDTESEIAEEFNIGIPEFREEFIFNVDSSTDVVSVYKKFVDEHPEMFWVNGSAKLLLENRIIKTRVTLIPNYIIEKESAEEKTALFTKKTEEFLNKVPENLNEFEKAVFVHDEIIKSTVYSDSDAEKILKGEEYDFTVSNAYGCIVNGSAVCAGYSEAYKFFMRKLGYKCDTVECTSVGGTGHALNCIYIKGEPYLVDVTNDDIDFESKAYSYTLDLASHTYFGMTTEEAKLYYVFEDGDPECTATEYNYFNYYGLNLSDYSFSEFNKIVSRYAESGLVEIKFSNNAQAENVGKIIYDRDMLKTTYFRSNNRRFTYTVSENSPVLSIYII